VVVHATIGVMVAKRIRLIIGHPLLSLQGEVSKTGRRVIFSCPPLIEVVVYTTIWAIAMVKWGLIPSSVGAEEGEINRYYLATQPEFMQM